MDKRFLPAELFALWVSDSCVACDPHLVDRAEVEFLSCLPGISQFSNG